MPTARYVHVDVRNTSDPWRRRHHGEAYCMSAPRTGMHMLITLQNLPFQKVRHQVSTTDAQPSNEAGGVMVMVTGALLVSGFDGGNWIRKQRS